MAEDATYTEYRADIAGLRDRPTGALKSGNFEYPVYPSVHRRSSLRTGLATIAS
jgi:hypothetical protein